MRYLRSTLIRRVTLIVFAVMAVKVAVHFMGWEFLSVNPLLSGIVAANVFLMGFLISGVLGDYKESERLPGELAASIESINDEVSIIYKSKKAESARKCLDHVATFTFAVRSWFYKESKTADLMKMIHGFNEFFLAFESVTQANFIARLKQEQSNLRRMVVRIHTIRETSFIASGYLIAEATTVLLTIGLVLLKMEPFYESLFFVFVICFLLNFLLLLIKRLDNPFGYYERDSLENVSLKPLDDLIREIQAERTRADGHEGVSSDGSRLVTLL